MHRVAAHSPKPDFFASCANVAKERKRSFLRLRRASVAPTDLGFSASKSRRTPGLRREEVAAAAGAGLTWYTALEQGKPIPVSTASLCHN